MKLLLDQNISYRVVKELRHHFPEIHSIVEYATDTFIFTTFEIVNLKVKNKETLLQLIHAHHAEITRFGVKELALFGSFKRNEAGENSDVDLLVEFEQGQKTFSNFMRLAFFLQDLFGRKVELLTRQSLSPFMGPKILKELEYVSLSA